MARRHTNGEGTIYQRKDGRWEGSLYVLTVSGTRKRVSVYGKTRAGAHEKLIEAKARQQRSIPTADKAWLLGEYLDYWLEHVVRPNRRPGTYAQCETIVRLYLKPKLGTKRISVLSVGAVQQCLNTLIATGTSVATTHVVRKVLSGALTRACREQIITYNVARMAELPPSRAREIQPWSPEEALTFLRSIGSHPLYPAFLAILTYGLRRGEVLGLRWEDVNFASRNLDIRQQVQRIGRGILIGPLKTAASRRTLPLVEAVEAALRIHAQKAASRPEHDLVFTSQNGTPLDPRNFSRLFTRLCETAGVRVITVHAMRHTTATILKDLGVPDRDAQLIFGHSRITTTQEIYQHGNMRSRRVAVEQLEQVLTLKRGPKASPSDCDGEPVTAVNGSRCRQNCRHAGPLIGWLTSIISGGAYRIRTDDLFHAMTIERPMVAHLSEVKRRVDVRTKQWILGAVAVGAAVKI
ncbi:tyrosine-type recombinase/integrase [Amycolatopsis azurea]|uniref:tyrosine-type recombinase/integrase n=1 Tax=Amycolatopsis azurea TaxID=36819 RepID=UPI00380B59EF